jgi:hypothetical protein
MREVLAVCRFCLCGTANLLAGTAELQSYFDKFPPAVPYSVQQTAKLSQHIHELGKPNGFARY